MKQRFSCHACRFNFEHEIDEVDCLQEYENCTMDLVACPSCHAVNSLEFRLEPVWFTAKATLEQVRQFEGENKR